MATGSAGYRIMYSMLDEYLLEEHRETGKMNPWSAKKKKKIVSSSQLSITLRRSNE